MSFSDISPQGRFVNTATEILDGFPIEKVEDFAIIQEALKAITEPQRHHFVPESLKQRVEVLQNLLNEPEKYIYGSSSDESREVVLDKIASRIKSYEKLSPNEKEEFVRKLHVHNAAVQQLDRQLKHWTANSTEIELNERTIAIVEKMDRLRAEGDLTSPEWDVITQELRAIMTLKIQREEEIQQGINDYVSKVMDVTASFLSRIFGR